MSRLKEFLNSSKFKMNYQENRLNIINYDEIVLLTSDKIILLKENKTITVKGTDLSLLKLLDSEVLISGVIKTIEL